MRRAERRDPPVVRQARPGGRTGQEAGRSPAATVTRSSVSGGMPCCLPLPSRLASRPHPAGARPSGHERIPAPAGSGHLAIRATAAWPAPRLAPRPMRTATLTPCVSSSGSFMATGPAPGPLPATPALTPGDLIPRPRANGPGLSFCGARRATNGHRDGPRGHPARTSTRSWTCVEAAGGEAFVSRGVTRTIIGLVGDVDAVRPARTCAACPGVADVMRVSAPYKLVSREHHPRRGPRVPACGGVPIGPDTFTLIAGPCAVETPEQTLEAAQMAQAAGATLLRGGAYKPRTSPYAFQGLGEAGLQILADVREETGLPIVTEVVDAARRGPGRVVRRHAAGRHPQHAELRAAAGGRRGRQAGACSSAA